MKIVTLTAENVKRLVAVEVSPNGAPIVVVSGDNEAGKSSLLDSIEMLLGGKDHIPVEPIRRGQAKARIVADLGTFIVTRRFTANGTTLEVTSRDGAKYPSPQALLDGLVGALAFDPLAFAQGTSLDDDRRREATLRALAQINTTTIDVARKAASDKRTLVNRDLAQAKAALNGLTRYPTVGLEPQSLVTLTEQLDAVTTLSNQALASSHLKAIAATRVADAQDRSAKATVAVQRARQALAQAEEAEEEAQFGVAMAEDAYVAAVEAADVAAAKVLDPSTIKTQIVTIQAHNDQVAANRQHQSQQKTVDTAQVDADALTAEIDRLDTEKAALLSKATFPLDGLGISDTGVTWQGLPFAQASTAIKTRVSVSIGAALSPRLKVLLVRNGNDLDTKNIALLAECAAEHGLQIWLEKIQAVKGMCSVVIEDGSVSQVQT